LTYTGKFKSAVVPFKSDVCYMHAQVTYIILSFSSVNTLDIIKLTFIPIDASRNGQDLSTQKSDQAVRYHFIMSRTNIMSSPVDCNQFGVWDQALDFISILVWDDHVFGPL
jgi:hypothetical protein